MNGQRDLGTPLGSKVLAIRLNPPKGVARSLRAPEDGSKDGERSRKLV